MPGTHPGLTGLEDEAPEHSGWRTGQEPRLSHTLSFSKTHCFLLQTAVGSVFGEPSHLEVYLLPAQGITRGAEMMSLRTA